MLLECGKIYIAFCDKFHWRDLGKLEPCDRWFRVFSLPKNSENVLLFQFNVGVLTLKQMNKFAVDLVIMRREEIKLKPNSLENS